MTPQPLDAETVVHTDTTILSGEIAEVRLEQKAAELQLGKKKGVGRPSRDEFRSLVEQLKGIVAVLQQASAEDRRAIYQELNVSIGYHTDGRLQVTAGPDACTNESVEGGT